MWVPIRDFEREKELCFYMKNRSFWHGLILGAIAGMALGLMMVLKEPLTPMEEAKVALGRVGRLVFNTMQGGIGRVVGRFSG